MKKVDVIYLETYTSCVPPWTIEFLSKLCGKDVKLITRQQLENENAKVIIKDLDEGKNVAFIVPGDPFIATTHNYVRVLAKIKGHEVHVVHGVSIISSVISLLGLSPYRVGPIATVTYPRCGVYSRRPYDIVKDNLNRNLHTILLLDISDEGGFMTIPEAVEILLKLEEMFGEGVFTKDRIVIGVARVGFPNYLVRCDRLEKLKS